MISGLWRALLWWLSAGMLLCAGCGNQEMVRRESLPQDHLAQAQKWYDQHKFQRSKEKLEKIKMEFPGCEVIGQVQFLYGMCQFQLKDYMAAESEFRTVINNFPAGLDYVADAHYFLALSCLKQAYPPDRDQTITRNAIAEFENFLSTYPQNDHADSVRYYLQMCYDKLAEKEFLNGRLYRKMEDYDAAILYFDALDKEYPKSKWVPYGQYEKALCYLALNKVEQAKSLAAALAKQKLDHKLRSRLAGLQKKLVRF